MDYINLLLNGIMFMDLVIVLINNWN